MNYWPRYIGDIQRKTGHLSCAEMGAYDRLLDHIYATEEPLPGDVDACCRIARAMDKSERKAVESVLRQFFALTEVGYTNSRAAEEIEKDAPRREAAKANGLKGGRPKGSGNKPIGFPAGNPAGTQDEPATKAPQPQQRENPLTPLQGEDRPGVIPCPYQAIVDAYHDALPSLPKVRLMGNARQRAMRKAWGWVLSSTKPDGTRRAETAEQALDWLRAYFARAGENDFLMGRTPRSAEHVNWQCDLDYLLTERGMRQVIEKTQEAA